VAHRHEIGLKNLMWGSDYPHPGSTWPRTLLALRNTFAGLPEDEAQAILGENAVGVFDLDYDKLSVVAERVGPTRAQVAEPVRPEELPQPRGLAFRELGSWS
jgi:hypothetical protein